MPDFVLCCNNICNCMIKWYENISKELNIPMYIIDIPFNPDYEVSDAEVEYIREQFWDVIHQLEAYTGKKWSDERFKEVMEISGRASRAWIEATSQAKYVPSPFNGFDLLNHMAVMVTARGKTEAAEAMEVLLKEYKENHEKGVSTFRQYFTEPLKKAAADWVKGSLNESFFDTAEGIAYTIDMTVNRHAYRLANR